MAEETRYAEQYRHAARGRMVGRRYVLSVCVPILGVFVPRCQGLGGHGKGYGPLHDRSASRDDYGIAYNDVSRRARLCPSSSYQGSTAGT
jgi:hypothetical protein